MKTNYRLGGFLTLIAALLGIVGHFIIFLNWYQIGMHAEAAEPGCEILLKYIMPGLADVGMLGGVLFAVSSYGFFTRKNWAFFLSVIAIVLALLASWFINVPFMAADLPPVYFALFWPYLIIYFLLMILVEHVSWSRTLLGLVTGIAYITCFMNGVSSTSRIITVGADIFFLVQRLHFVAMLGWGVVTAGIVLRPMEWMRVVGLVSGGLELTVGIPLAFVTAQRLGRFSLFALAPIFSLILVVIFVWPGLWQRLTEDKEKEPVVRAEAVAQTT
jgi:NADH:ubiquinone oxidoreductase subunit K